MYFCILLNSVCEGFVHVETYSISSDFLIVYYSIMQIYYSIALAGLTQ